MVEPSFAKRTIINHKKYLQNGRVVTSPAVKLVIATDHNDVLPKTRQEKLSLTKSTWSGLAAEIVGGGLSGVEFATEIAVDFPDKKRFFPGLVHVKLRD